MTVGIKEAKNELSKLLEAVAAGEEVLITKRGQVVARLVAEAPAPAMNRGRGCLKDVALPPGWDSRKLDDEITGLFETR